jgi:glycosyltransferase involved in cell wall biosynthesis
MKILIIGSKEYPLGTDTDDDDVLPSGGIEVYVQDMVYHLAKTHKTEIVVITRRFSTTPKYEKNKDVEIFRVRWLKGFFFRNISFNFMAFIKALRIDFDIIYSHAPIATSFGLALSKIKKTPIITAPLGLASQQPQYNKGIKKFFSILEKFVYSRSDCVIFSHVQQKEVFEKKLGFSPEKYRIIHPGVDTKRFENIDGAKIKKEYKILKNEKVITFVGRLIEVKGLRYLIEAIRQLKGHFHVLIVGSGDQREELEAMVSRLKLKNVVTFTGRVKSIPDILAATDIFVLPSVSEGLPIALLEAMAASKACVVTDIGLPVEDGTDALVVKPCVVDELSNALKHLLNNEDLRNKLGTGARKKAKQNFSWDRAVEEYLRLFEELVPEPDDSP